MKKERNFNGQAGANSRSVPIDKRGADCSAFMVNANNPAEKAASDLATAIRAVARPVIDGWGASVVCGCAPAAESGCETETVQDVAIGVSTHRLTVPGEIVRVHFDPLYVVPLAAEISRLARLELAPFIIGVGEIAIEDAPDGFVIRLCDVGKERTRHEPRYSTETPPAMIEDMITPEMIRDGRFMTLNGPLEWDEERGAVVPGGKAKPRRRRCV